jgi:hypothetical protein
VSEARFSMKAEGKDPSGHADFRFGGLERGCVSRPVFLEQFLRGCRAIEFVRIGFMPARLDLGKLFLALKKLVDWIKR